MLLNIININIFIIYFKSKNKMNLNLLDKRIENYTCDWQIGGPVEVLVAF